jgi:hypothetical protein
MSFFLFKVNNPSVRHPVWPVGHFVWLGWAPRLALLGTPFGPRRAPCLASFGHPSGTPSGPRQAPSWKRGKKTFQFSVFNPQDPQDPRVPRVPRAPLASRAKPRDEEGFFGLVPLVTHPSSIRLLGGLTPKFLSLSFHSL